MGKELELNFMTEAQSLTLTVLTTSFTPDSLVSSLRGWSSSVTNSLEIVVSPRLSVFKKHLNNALRYVIALDTLLCGLF